MSQSPTKPVQLDGDSTYLQNWDELGTRISRSQSFSGRERNCCFLNTGQSEADGVARFANVSGAVNLDLIDDCRGIVSTDWDHDGDLDFWISTRTAPSIRFLRNDLNSGNRSLAISLEGRSCNRDAIGARVTVQLDRDRSHPLIQTVRAGDAFVSQSSKWLHFGIPHGTNVNSVMVRWPGSSHEEEFRNFDGPGKFKFIQGSGMAKRQEFAASPIATIEPVAVELPDPSANARVVLTRRRHLPALEFVDFEGNKQSFSKMSHGAILVNLWASWCSPCIAELTDLKARAADLRERNVHIVALSTDGVEDAQGRSNLPAAAKLMKQLRLPFAAGVCGEKLLREMRAMHSRIFYKDHPLPMPTSFLVDPKGAVAIVYRGPINPDLLFRDIDLIESTDPSLVSAAVYPLGGRSGIGMLPINGLGFAKAYFEGGYYEDAKRELTGFLGQMASSVVEDHSSPSKSANSNKQLAEAHHMMAKTQERLGHLQSAVDAYRDALRFSPNALGARASLAIVLWQQGKHSEAEVELQNAEREPTDVAKTHALLGRIRMQWNQPKRAVLHFQTALTEHPDSRSIRLELALALRAADRTAQAVQQYQRLLAIDPRDLLSANNLAWVYATNSHRPIRNESEALRLALFVCQETDHNNPSFLDTLAAAYAANGQFSRAIAAAEKALSLYNHSGSQDMANPLRKRLQFYQQRMPFLEDPKTGTSQ